MHALKGFVLDNAEPEEDAPDIDEAPKMSDDGPPEEPVAPASVPPAAPCLEFLAIQLYMSAHVCLALISQHPKASNGPAWRAVQDEAG